MILTQALEPATAKSSFPIEKVRAAFPALEREVNGRTMYRVRLGPFSQKDMAEQARVTLSGGGVESALVRVQK